MSKVCQHEGNPGEEEVPDQPQVLPRLTVSHPRKDQPNAGGTGEVEQDEYCDAIFVLNDIFTVVHISLKK